MNGLECMGSDAAAHLLHLYGFLGLVPPGEYFEHTSRCLACAWLFLPSKSWRGFAVQVTMVATLLATWRSRRMSRLQI